MSFSHSIKTKALELGFSKVAICPSGKLDGRNGLRQWLSAGYAGDMSWLQSTVEKRLDPSIILPRIQSVIAVALNYYSPFSHSENPLHGKISRYAWGRDYHRVLQERMKTLLEWIKAREPSAEGLYYSDTGPLMDKAWAHKSGLGWIGKHSNVITRERGSWIFLGEILLNLKLEYDGESRNYCGTCKRCIDSCPTKAIVAPYTVDARLCISYLTIELRGPIPREMRKMIGTRIFGCDDCQDVCPWNRFATPSSEISFYPDPGNQVPALVELMRMTESEFKERFRHSPVKRARYPGFLRNVAVALGNSHNPGAREVLEESLKHPEPLVRAHAAWALGEIGVPASLPVLADACASEKEPWVAGEIEQAMDALHLIQALTVAVGRGHQAETFFED
jgi:epoxyqueuosine reductase